jgi:hypothetical protein
MKIIGTTKYNTPCLWTCIGKGIEGLSKYTNIPIIIYDQQDIANGNIIKDNDDIILLFEAGCFQHAGWSLSKVKDWFPNSKLIPIAADTNIYLFLRNQHQLDYELVDLWLDLDTRCIDYYKNLGIQADQWMWTISDWFIDYIKKTTITLDTKRYDFIGVYHIVSMIDGYRARLINYLKDHNLSFTNGGGNGHEDNDLERLINYYYHSHITLGTTSHNIGEDFRTPKGFRDWIGPFTGTPLIYDDYPMIMDCYQDTVPYYKYKDFDSIVELYNKYKGDQKLLQKQQTWATNNTIDKQLYRLLQKYEFISP